MRIFLTAVAAVAAVALAACGELGNEIERAKEQASELGQEAIRVADGAIGTREACLLAGQSAAFCTCLSDRLGPDITEEHVSAIAEATRTSVQSGGADIQSAVEQLDPATREAFVQCGADAAVQAALSEAAQ